MQEHHQNRTRALLKDSTPYGPKYNLKHGEHIFSQPCMTQDNSIHSERNIYMYTVNGRF